MYNLLGLREFEQLETNRKLKIVLSLIDLAKKQEAQRLAESLRFWQYHVPQLGFLRPLFIEPAERNLKLSVVLSRNKH